MSDTEVMTTALVATFCFGGNWAHACRWLHTPYYIPRMLRKSRFNRRLHRVKPVFLTLFACLSEVWKELNAEYIHSIDTFPISVCDNIRISRAKIHCDKAYQGYIPSKRRYFYGLKLHLMVTEQGQPVEFFLTPGAFGGVSGLDLFDFDLPPDLIVYADRAYNSCYLEDLLQEANQTSLQPMRKKGSRRPFPPHTRFLQYYFRKRIETSRTAIGLPARGSRIEGHDLNHITTRRRRTFDQHSANPRRVPLCPSVRSGPIGFGSLPGLSRSRQPLKCPNDHRVYSSAERRPDSEVTRSSQGRGLYLK